MIAQPTDILNNTVLRVPHDRCTGCGACLNRCPAQAIRMALDGEGFPYPAVDADTCVRCGACLAVCPAEHPLTTYPIPKSYAVWADKRTRRISSSGGMFSVLARHAFAEGGAVCGARYTGDFLAVYHDWAESERALAPLRGSKYVQSDTGLTYRQAKQTLDAGRTVLYTGCPCQIAGLYRYLGGDRDRLITADVICHGANSQTAFRAFVTEYAEGREIARLDFRDKRAYGWSTPTVMEFRDGTVKQQAWNEGEWYKGFLGGVTTRLCCAQCPYARAERIADFTLGDCWQVHRVNPKYDDRLGTSLVLVNSPKAQALWPRLSRRMRLCAEVDLEALRPYNPQLNRPSRLHRSRRYFFSHLPEMGYHAALSYGLGERFDVGVVGWWFANSYSSALSYYAVCATLERMGRQVLLIPPAKPDGTPWEPETQEIIRFQQKWFQVAPPRVFRCMSGYNSLCDSFLTGPDLLWTGAYLNLLRYTFFLDFVDADKKKIAFSTTLRRDDAGLDDTARDLVRRFDAVSVRSAADADLCRARFGVEAQVLPDPLLVCGREAYDRLTDGLQAARPAHYLLCSVLDPDPELEAMARAAAERKQLDILTVFGLRERAQSAARWHTGTVLPRLTVAEYVDVIRHADAVLTDSPDSVCLCILYHRPYAAYTGGRRGEAPFMAAAEALGLTDRLIRSSAELLQRAGLLDAFDARETDARLAAMRARAEEWLREALAAPVAPVAPAAPAAPAAPHGDTPLTRAAADQRKVTGPPAPPEPPPEPAPPPPRFPRLRRLVPAPARRVLSGILKRWRMNHEADREKDN